MIVFITTFLLLGSVLGDINKLKCCEFKGKQASKIESTSLCCRSYSILHVIDKRVYSQSSSETLHESRKRTRTFSGLFVRMSYLLFAK